MRKSNLFLIIATAFFVIFAACKPAASSHDAKLPKLKVEISCVAFYNLENLFDTINNEGVNDEEYTPQGSLKWNTVKYNAKQEKMSYAISQLGIDVTPVGAAIIGVCEVENRLVLEDLVSRQHLAKRNYEIVHYDGPDRRGVDVALLYNPRYFTVSNSKSYPVNDPEVFNYPTRDQLMVSGFLQGERVHIIVNHWPSRGGGEASVPRRAAAAKVTRSIVDSLFRVEPRARIMVMGDFNDDPFNESVAVVLGAKKDIETVKPGQLYNPFWKTLERGVGTLTYRDQWNLFDQIILSHELLNKERGKLKFWKSEVFNRSFLMQNEGRYKGSPLRTHGGGVWLNGYSDHLPTMVYLIKELE